MCHKHASRWWRDILLLSVNIKVGIHVLKSKIPYPREQKVIIRDKSKREKKMCLHCILMGCNSIVWMPTLRKEYFLLKYDF